VRILLAEDDARLGAQIKEALQAEAFVCDWVQDGASAAHLGGSEPYDAVVLDLGLPQRDGLSLLRDWRSSGHAVPVLILTVRDAWSDKLDGFRAGADDYLTKPFRMDELTVRLRALIRRAAGHASPLLTCGRLELDTTRSQFTLQGMPLQLTAFEFQVLEYFMHHPGRILSRTELSEHLYGMATERDYNSLEVIVSRLRRKLGPRCIETIRGQGYRLVAQ
jgi:two-component system OmpR family response regulator